MKCILRNYGKGMNQQQRLTARNQATTMVITQGTSKIPLPPRDVFAQSGPRGVLLNWRPPGGFNTDIAGWRIYKDNESSLFAEIKDPATTQHFVDATAGSTPPVTNFFVSSINKTGVESGKVQIKASAISESSAPTMPSTPPSYYIPPGTVIPGYNAPF